MDRVIFKEGLAEKILYFLVSVAVCVLTMFLFFDFEKFSIVILLAVPFLVKILSKRAEERRRWALNVAFLDGLQFMKNSLLAGYSPEGSIREAKKGLEKLYGKSARITMEFATMQAQLSMGITLEEALNGFAKRSRVEDITNFAELFSILKRTGGDLEKVIRQTTSNLRDRVELARDLNIVAAEKQGEFRLMCLIPYGILLYLKVCSPSMSAPLYHNIVGCVFMSVVFAAYVGCVCLGEWILISRMKE